MQLNSATSEAAILASLEQAAEETWGKDRLEELRGPLGDAAHQAWLVLQVPLTALDDEPDFPAHAARQPGEK